MKCCWCGTEYNPPHHSSRHCTDECKRLHRNAQTRESQAKHKPVKAEKLVVILKDPDPCGGFPKGATISTLELQCCLGIGAFTPGTIIQEESQIWRIEGKDGYEQRKVLA